MSRLYVGAGDSLQALQSVEVDEEALRDIELRIKLQPHFLGEPMVVIGETADFPQMAGQEDAHTLVALDVQGQVVVIELKLGIARAQHPLQALRFASHIASLRTEDLGKIAHSFIHRPGNIGLLRAWQEENVEMSDEAVELSSLLATTFERDADDFAELVNRSQRIVVAAEAFDSGMVEIINWLAENGTDIRGLHYGKFMIGGQEIYFAEQAVPKVDPAVDATGDRTVAAEAEEPWRTKGLPYYQDRLTPAAGAQLRNLLALIRPHAFSVAWSHKYYFVVQGARRNLRIRVYHRDRVDIGFLNVTVEGANEFLAHYGLLGVECSVIGGYEKSPFVLTTSDTEFDDRWRAVLGDWLSGAPGGTTTPDLPQPERVVR